MNRETAQNLLVGAHAFINDQDLKEWEGLSREDFIYLINSLFDNDNFLDSVGLLEKVASEELQASALPPDLENLINQWENAKEQNQEIRKKSQEEVRNYIEKRKKSYLPLAEASKQRPIEKKTKTEEEQWQEINEDLTNKIQNQLIVFDPSLAHDPELLKKLTEEIKKDVVSLALNEEESVIEKNLAPLVNESLTKNGYLINSQKQEAFSGTLYESSQKDIQEIRATNDSPITQEILDKYSQNTENVIFTPAYVLANPSLLIAYSKKAFVALPVKFLQQSAEETSPEWQKMLKQGVFVENYDLTIQALIKCGLTEKHPAIVKLQNERDRLYDAQKNSTGKDKPLVGLLKTFYKPNELTGNQKGASESTGIALSGKTLWHNGKGWAFNLKNAFNQIGLTSKIYQKFPSLPGKTLMTSRLSVGTIAWSNRRLWRPIYLAVAKTAAGKAVKVGIKKASVWVATKLGLQATLSAAGIASGVGAIPTVVINVVVEAVGFIWNKGIKPIIHKISQWVKEPDKAFAAILVGIGIMVFVPAFAIAGVVLVGLGTLGVIAGAGTILGGLAIGTVGFFTALIAGPVVGFSLATAVIIGVIILSSLTFFIIMTTAGAFILPQGGSLNVSTPPVTAVAPECNLPRNLAENVVCIIQSCNLQFVTTNTISQTEDCLRNSSLLNKEVLISYFKASVSSYNNLQCVGFVQGVMAALSKNLEGRDAKNYALAPPPPGYSLYLKSTSDINQVQVGDLSFWTGGDWGHIMIVVAKDGNTITVSNALGNTGYVGNGKYPASVFDGYLRPN